MRLPWNLLLPMALSGLVALQLAGQENRFYMPAEIRQAYEKGTRAYDGRPGAAYWQNTVDYDIDVRVDPSQRRLEGTEKAVYHNNSPDPISVLVVRLYYDVFKKGNARAGSVHPEDVTDEGTDLRRIAVNGRAYNLDDPQQTERFGTNLSLRLAEPLAPGDRLTFEAEWSQPIPLTNRRTGAYDSTSFFVAYWYPQIAVYDDIFGWDQLSYNLRTEFYNNLANFDVRITVPESFTVWATGELQNADQLLPPNFLERYRRAKTATETVSVLSPDDLREDYRNQSGAWHYRANEVSDFAFALSDHYCWDAAAQRVEGRDVLISTVYPADRAAEFPEVTAIQQKTMKHFSEDMPGIPYPYPAFTTFIGLFGGGMEFPMMANNDGPGAGVTIHEMFHTYFPMYVRINEKRFAWMDEGWANFVTSFVTQRYFENKEGPILGGYRSQMQAVTGTISDLPLITSSQFMDNSNYGYASYPLPAFVYSILHHHLGDELFTRAYREYIRRWAKKSPTPYDFFYTFENVSGQDLAWLWSPWFFEFGYPDLTIQSFKKGKLVLENRGDRPVPVKVGVTYEDGSTREMLAGAGVWKSGKTHLMEVPDYKKVKYLNVNLDMPDATELDNFSPPLAEVYAGFDLPADLAGVYAVKEFPVDMVIEHKNDLLFMTVQGAGLQTYLMPKSATTLESLDGAVQLEFLMEEGVCKGAGIKAFGFNLTAEKK